MQVRVMVSLFVAVLLLPSCHKADSSGSVSDLTPPAEEPWKEFTSAEDAFIVFFPTIPEKKSQDNQYDFGKVTITAYTSHPKRNVVWRVAVHNYPEPFALFQDGIECNAVPLKNSFYAGNPMGFEIINKDNE